MKLTKQQLEQIVKEVLIEAGGMSANWEFKRQRGRAQEREAAELNLSPEEKAKREKERQARLAKFSHLYADDEFKQTVEEELSKVLKENWDKPPGWDEQDEFVITYDATTGDVYAEPRVNEQGGDIWDNLRGVEGLLVQVVERKVGSEPDFRPGVDVGDVLAPKGMNKFSRIDQLRDIARVPRWKGRGGNK